MATTPVTIVEGTTYGPLTFAAPGGGNYAVYISYSTTDGTAKARQDYTPVNSNGVVEIPQGAPLKLYFETLRDGIAEPDEHFFFSYSAKTLDLDTGLYSSPTTGSFDFMIPAND